MSASKKNQGQITGYIENSGQIIKYCESYSNKQARKIESKFLIKSMIESQITKEQLNTMCENLKVSISSFHKNKLMTQKEREEIYECNSNGEFVDEKIINPVIQDFIKLEYIFYPNQITRKLFWKVFAIVPDIKITINQIKGFGIVKTPMSIKLLQKHTVTKTGFLTLDQDRRLVCLHPSDPKSKTFTLVGIWANGEDNAFNDRLIYAAILRFLFNEEIKSKMSSGSLNSLSYLMLFFPKNQELPLFYEIQVTNSNNLWKLIECSNEISYEHKNISKPISFTLSCHKSRTNTSYTIKNFPIPFQRKAELKIRSRNSSIKNSQNLNTVRDSQPNVIKKLIKNNLRPRGISERRVVNLHESKDSEISSKMDEVEEGVKGSMPYITQQKENFSACRKSLNNLHFPTECKKGNITPERSLQTSPSNNESSLTLQKIIMEQQKQIQAMQQQFMMIAQELDLKKKKEGLGMKSLIGFGKRLDTTTERYATQRNSFDKSSGMESNFTFPSPRGPQLSTKENKIVQAPYATQSNSQLTSPERKKTRATSYYSKPSGEESQSSTAETPKQNESVQRKNINVTDFTVRMGAQSKITNVIPQEKLEESNSKALSAIKETNESIYSPEQDPASNKKGKNPPSSKQKVQQNNI